MFHNAVFTNAWRLFTVAALAVASSTAALAQGVNLKWVGTWAVSPQTQESLGGTPPAAPTFTNVTLRQIVHTSIGGNSVRVRISNTFGTGDLVIGAAHIGIRGSTSDVKSGTDSVLTFSGRPTVTVPPGALVISDAVANFAVPALSDLAISIYLPNTTAGSTLHSEGKQTNYVLDGDQTGSLTPAAISTQLPYYFLTNVETLASANVRGIVCMGDSITDGTNSTPDTNHRWPNYFAQRLLTQSTPAKVKMYAAGIMDQGISGNRLLHNLAGPDGLSRFDRDVIAQTGVTDIILLEGINDIGFGGFVPTQIVSSDDIIAAYKQVIARAHDAGLKIYGATLTPFAVTTVVPGYYSDGNEAKREAVNAFIRSGGAFDGVIDFEAALTDGQSPPHLQAQFDSGDHLHPSDAGYQAMANAINIAFFKHLP